MEKLKMDTHHKILKTPILILTVDMREDERGEEKNVCMVGWRKAEEKTGEWRSKGGQRGGEAKRGRGRKKAMSNTKDERKEKEEVRRWLTQHTDRTQGCLLLAIIQHGSYLRVERYLYKIVICVLSLPNCRCFLTNPLFLELFRTLHTSINSHSHKW